MATCAGGAHPTGGFVEFSVAVQGAAIGATMWEFVSGFWPAAAGSAVLAQIPLTKLCDMNPDDPGTFDWNQMVADWFTAGVPGFDSAPGTLGYWVFQKALYQEFSKYCICNDTTTPPPPIVAVPPPGDQWTFPPGPDNQPQLNRIELSLKNSSDGLLSLYNGLQLGLTDARDMAWRERQSRINTTLGPTWTMSGEGVQALLPSNFGGQENYQDTFGILVQLTRIPSTVKRRGTQYQRLYGVGSIEWNAGTSSATPHVISQRDALHYEQQFLLAPQRVISYYVRWRLQPGVVAVAQQLVHNPFLAYAAPLQAAINAYQPFSEWGPPQNWTDPPFYQQGTPQLAAAGNATPYRLASPP